MEYTAFSGGRGCRWLRLLWVPEILHGPIPTYVCSEIVRLMTHGPEMRSDYVVVRDFACAVLVWSCDRYRISKNCGFALSPFSCHKGVI